MKEKKAAALQSTQPAPVLDRLYKANPDQCSIRIESIPTASAPPHAAIPLRGREMALPTSPPPPSWVILGSIPRVSADLPPDADLALALSEPPRVSLLTIPPRLFPDAVTPRNYPSIRAADPSGLLLLHANQGRAKGPTVIDRPGNYSFCWLEFVAGYFVLDTASASSLALPHPEYIMHPGNVGIIASPARDGAYMVAELQPIIGGVEASLLCFSSNVGEWVDKSVRYPVPPRPSAANGVVSHNGRLWWIDLSWGLITCDPFADAPVLTFVPLPPGKALEYNEACGILDKYRAIRVSAGKLRFVDMYRNRDNRGALKVSVWTLADPDATEWTLEHEASFADIWDDPTYKAAGLPNKIPLRLLPATPSRLDAGQGQRATNLGPLPPVAPSAGRLPSPILLPCRPIAPHPALSRLRSAPALRPSLPLSGAATPPSAGKRAFPPPAVGPSGRLSPCHLRFTLPLAMASTGCIGRGWLRGWAM
ncbi:hypothetical protein PR202_ga25964 [Eleusine coracana subsp. coracana]|uniref:DUF1618 domain-containing protein n=1 Tax=Eleusine coracana subsp. coracana TaxID=191504 RepID=A0AAV5DCU7_ELECO|nr:hypothetical protein PR202_ga25964 [Eleusine coracana subsp. coracana]